MGLVQDDKEWDLALEESSNVAMSLCIVDTSDSISSTSLLDA